jgi:hypothetical protein
MKGKHDGNNHINITFMMLLYEIERERGATFILSKHSISLTKGKADKTNAEKQKKCL